MTRLYGYHQARTIAYRTLSERYGWLDDHRPYRAWEWPHALMALDVLPEHEVLSIGACHCGVTAALSGAVRYLYAVDLHSQFLTWGAEHFSPDTSATRTEYERADGRNLPCADESFDRVACVSVLEHVREEADGDTLVAQEMGRLLRPGGLAVVTLEVAKQWTPWAPPVGRLYDLEHIMSRVVEPSGLELLNPEGLDWDAGDWDHIWEDIPRRGLPDLIPAALVLRKSLV